MEDGVRFAETEEELRASFRLRYKVYVESMGRLKDKSDHERRELRDRQDEVARAVVAIKDGEAIGTLRLFWGGDASFSDTLVEAYRIRPFLDVVPEDRICVVERLMVDEAHRGSSAALRLYKQVMCFVFEKKVEAIFLDCEPHHLNSYLKLGFRPFADTYSYPGIGLVVPMVLICGDYQHLRDVGSPFSMLVTEDDLRYCEYTDQLRSLIGQQHVFSEEESEPSEFLKKIYAFPGLLDSAKPKIFDDLTETEIRRVVRRSHIIEVTKGDRIIEKNNAARTMFVLLSGIAEVWNNEQLQAVISPGELIGEIAFFLNKPRSATIRAATDDVRVLSLDEASMSRLLKHDAELANKLLMNIAKTLCYRVVAGIETTDLRS